MSWFKVPRRTLTRLLHDLCGLLLGFEEGLNALRLLAGLGCVRVQQTDPRERGEGGPTMDGARVQGRIQTPPPLTRTEEAFGAIDADARPDRVSATFVQAFVCRACFTAPFPLTRPPSTKQTLGNIYKRLLQASLNVHPPWPPTATPGW